jgi:hypothetical protein
MSKVFALPLGVLIVLVSCAGRQQPDLGLGKNDRLLQDSEAAESRPDRIAPSVPSPPPPPACQLFQKEGVLFRSALTKVINAGLGRWLGEVEGDRAILKGRFQGWIVKRLHPQDPCYQHLPIQPGDIVLRINQKRIEKPEQAFEVFESLRTARELQVNYLHQGKAEVLQIEIVDD